MKNLTLAALLLAGLFFATGCEKKTPEEKAADSIKKAANDTTDAEKDSANKAEKAVKKAMKCQAGKCGSK